MVLIACGTAAGLYLFTRYAAKNPKAARLAA